MTNVGFLMMAVGICGGAYSNLMLLLLGAGLVVVVIGRMSS